MADEKSSRKNPFDTAAAKYLTPQPATTPAESVPPTPPEPPPPAEPEQPKLSKAEREAARIRQRRARRATYDLPPEVRKIIEPTFITDIRDTNLLF